MAKNTKLPPPESPLEMGITSSTDPATQSDVTETTASSGIGASNTGVNDTFEIALMKAQSEMKNVVMNKVNPHFKSKYADLSAVRDVVVPTFARHGFSIVQAPDYDDSGFFLGTTLFHTSGEAMKWRFPLPSGKMQEIGSAISYARRYTLSAIANIASEEDDDGNQAQNTNGGGPKADGGLPPRHEQRPTGAQGIVL